MSDLDADTEAALNAAFFGAGEAPIAEARRRGKAEHQMGVGRQDGRSKRATGRTAQFNVGVKPDIKANFARAAKRAGLSVTDFFEALALEAIAKHLGEGRRPVKDA